MKFQISASYRTWLIGIFFVVPVTVLLFNNCGKDGFNTLANFDSSGEGLASPSPAPAVLPKASANIHVLNGEQAINSMLSLTGTPQWTSGLNYTVQNEGTMHGLTYNPQLEEFVGTSQIALMNFASMVCGDAIERDFNLAPEDPARKFVPVGIKRYMAVKDWPQGALDLSMNNMGRLFWGRELYPEERQAIETSLQEYFSGTQAPNTDPTTNYFVFLCTGMLSSLESITY